MFGFSRKSKAVDVLRQSASGAVDEVVFQIKHVSKLSLNDQAANRLVGEALSHCIYCTIVAFCGAFKAEPWATKVFAYDVISRDVFSAMVKEQPGSEPLARHVLVRVAEIGEELAKSRGGEDFETSLNRQFLASARSIAALDRRANAEQVAATIKQSAETQFFSAQEQFARVA